MMSLGVSKGGVIPPSEEDRKKIIRQMKVRTTLKGDKSWIYPQNSDNEKEMKSSPLHSPCRSGKMDGGSPASASVTPHGDRLPGSKPTSGYLIRGVFTRTIDKTPPESTFYSNGTQKSAAAQAKSATVPHFSSGYKMTTEDYKKLAPFNVRQISVESDEEKPSFSPDEHKKRTEAANSVLRRTASRERSYVLSAAKKSHGSPTQEVSPFIAKRVETEEEGGLRMQSQTLPASSRFGLGGKSDKVDEEKPVGTSPGEATTSKPALATGRSEERVINVPKPMPQSEIKLRVTSSPEKSDKPVKEEPDLISWDESIPKATTISTGESEKEEVHVDNCDHISSEESYPDSLEADNEFDPIKSNSYYMDNTADPPSETRHWYRVPEYLDDTNSDLTRSSPQSRDIPAHHTDARFTVPGYLGDTECDPKRSVPCYEERRPTREIRYESTRATEHKEPELNVAKFSPSSGDSSAVTQEVRYKVPMHLDDEEFDFNSRSSSHSTESNVTINDPRHRIPGCMEVGELDPERLSPLKGNTEDAENENISTTRSKPLTTRKHTEPDVNTAQSVSFSRDNTITSTDANSGGSPYMESLEPASQRSSSPFRDSSITMPETLCTEHNKPDVNMTRIAPDYKERNLSSRETSQESPQARRHKEPDLNSEKSNSHSRQSTFSMIETCHVMPSYLNRQQYNTSMSELSQRIPSYLDNQVYNTRRTVPGYEGRSSPRDTRYESPRARGHNEFDPNMGRLPSASSERISMSTASSQYHSPSAVGYKSNPSTASKGILFVKEYVNSRELSPRDSSDSLVDLSDIERASYLHSSASQRSCEGVCTYCGHEIRDCPKIMIEHLNVYCHEYCFRCGICHKAMGDLLDKIFIHRDIVHCDQCYEKLF